MKDQECEGVSLVTNPTKSTLFMTSTKTSVSVSVSVIYM